MSDPIVMIFDHPLCAECGLCCLPWQHKLGAPARYPCAHLTERGCELDSDARPDACREFACKRLIAYVEKRKLGDATGVEGSKAMDRASDEPMGREEEWLLALFETYLLAGIAETPEWYRATLERNRARRRMRLARLGKTCGTVAD